MGHNLIIIVMQKKNFEGFYGIDTDIIHQFVLFEHQCHVHCLNISIICLFVLFVLLLYVYLCYLYIKVMHMISMFK